jgi:hypothetical protein
LEKKFRANFLSFARKQKQKTDTAKRREWMFKNTSTHIISTKGKVRGSSEVNETANPNWDNPSTTKTAAVPTNTCRVVSTFLVPSVIEAIFFFGRHISEFSGLVDEGTSSKQGYGWWPVRFEKRC